MLDYDYRLIEPGDRLYLTAMVRYNRSPCIVTAMRYEVYDGDLYWFFRFDKRGCQAMGITEKQELHLPADELFFVGNDVFEDQYYLAWMSIFSHFYHVTERIILGSMLLNELYEKDKWKRYFSNTIIYLDGLKENMQEFHIEHSYLRSLLKFIEVTERTGEYNEVLDITMSLVQLEKIMRCVTELTVSSALLDELVFYRMLYGQYLERADFVGNKYLQGSTGKGSDSSRSV